MNISSNLCQSNSMYVFYRLQTWWTDWRLPYVITRKKYHPLLTFQIFEFFNVVNCHRLILFFLLPIKFQKDCWENTLPVTAGNLTPFYQEAGTLQRRRSSEGGKTRSIVLAWACVAQSLISPKNVLPGRWRIVLKLPLWPLTATLVHI